MKPLIKGIILFGVVIAAGGILAMKSSKPGADTMEPSETATGHLESSLAQEARPRLLDLGAGKCVPCRMMKPILDELMANHTHQFETVFVDVWLDPEQGRAHGVRVIPTQIFYDEAGEELWRHEGFMSKEDIFKAWDHLGFTFSMTAEDV